MRTFIAKTAGQRLNSVGVKGKEWIKEKKKLVKIYKEKGITRCENCNGAWGLSFHHRPKRSSQEAIHDFDHTRLLDVPCHDFFEYNDEADKKLFDKPRGYDPKFKIEIMADKKKSKKAEWEAPRVCINCKKKIAGFLLCPFCGEISIKK